MLIFPQNRTQIDSVNQTSDITVFSNIEENIRVFKQNVKDAQSIGYSAGKAQALLHLGLAQYLFGQYAQSVESYLSCIRILESLHDTERLITAYGELGYQMKRRDLAGGLKYMSKAIKLGEKHKAKFKLTALYDNFGVLQEMGGHLDSAAYYYRKGLNLKIEVKDTLGLPYSYNSLAGLYMETKQYNEAQRFLEEAEEAGKQNPDHFVQIYTQVLWGDFYRSIGAVDSAITAYQKVLKDPTTQEHKYQVAYCLNYLAALYETKKDFGKALDYLQQYKTVNDSLVNTETNSEIARLQITYETEKKDRELAENKLAIEHRTSLLIISTLVVLLLLILVISVFVFHRQSIRRLNDQAEADKQLKQAQYRRNISEEKLRISRELHDNVGSHLTFLISSLDNVTYMLKNRPDVQKKIEGLSSFGRNTMSELRNTIWAMRSKDVSLNSLIKKLEQIRLRFSEMYESIEIMIENRCEDNIDLSSIQMVNIFRTAQEAIQNALKHSNCTNIKIMFATEDDRLCMSVQDDGTGFDPDTVTRGNGLENMTKRCEQIGGEFAINSNSHGTEIRLRVNTD